MHNNVTKDDRDELIRFLKTDPILTNGPKVLEFEEAWSKWLGVKYSVFVNSGASANLLTMAYLNFCDANASKEVIVPTLTWVSDIASVLQNGFKLVFKDIDPRSLGMEIGEKGIPKSTKAVFTTHVLGLCAAAGFDTGIEKILIEDCCESHGALWPDGTKVGTKGRISNFSFYFAHHMTTIEGGMVCTNDHHAYECIRMLRSHGMVREIRDRKTKEHLAAQYPNLHPSFIFMLPAYNCRNTELGAVLGLSQLKRLDEQIQKRKDNWDVFFHEISPKLYRTELNHIGSSPYALIPILNDPDLKLRNKIERMLTLSGVEFRRGLSGGGNQLRQPYLEALEHNPKDYPEVEHVSDFAWYIGNYPTLEHKKIAKLCKLLNQF
jgi:CDP-6-deoxy-D-xylo-4-hexulose-3-dehydrase